MNGLTILWVGIAGLLVLLFLPQVTGGLKAILGKLWPAGANSTAATAIEKAADTASTYVDEAVAWTALRTAALLFKKHGDNSAASTLGGLASKVMQWDDEPVSPNGQG